MTSQLGLSSNSCCQSQQDRMTLCTALATPRRTTQPTFHICLVSHRRVAPCTHMTSECHKRVHAGPTHVQRPHTALDTGCPQYGLVYFAKNLNLMNSTAFVLFGKYCSIVDQLGSKDSSRDFQLNCVISYFFTYI
jgi:hypothetical protein